jgi:hypothetical protein
MNTIAYTYSIVRYVHSPATGERLNVGVILCAAEADFIGGQFDYNYERLSKAFAGFDGTHYRRVLRQLQTALENLKLQPQGTLITINDKITDARQLGRMLIPDNDLSFEVGQMLAGVTDNPMAELCHIFGRLVLEQYATHRAEHRTDEYVWHNSYRPAFAKRKLTSYLQPKSFVAEDYRLEFEHSFKNDKWHIVQPATMDYARSSSLQEKATKMLGQATALHGHPDLAKVYLLLGAPQPEHRKEYIKAMNLLHKMPIEHQLIEEDEAEQFAEELAAYIHEHGVEGPLP